MRTRNLLILGIIYLVIVLVEPLVSVFSSEAASTEILHLGATVPFQSRIGIQLKNILYMNADLLNKGGGLTIGGKTYKIEYHIYDDKYQADPGRAAIEKLVFEDKINFNVGTFASAAALAMLGVTESNKIPVFHGAASEKLISPDVKYFVHCYPTKFSIAGAKALRELRPDVKALLICTYDDETGHSMVPPLTKAFKHFGIEPLPALYFKHGETDFSRVANKAISLKPDYIKFFGVMVAAEYVQFIKALFEAGYKGTIEASYISQKTLDEIIGKVGKERAEGLYIGLLDPTYLSGPEEIPQIAMDFRKNYEKYYGSWEMEGLQWAGCWYTWLAAIKKANSIDPDRVMGAVDKDLIVPTPLGLAKFFRRPDLGNNKYCDYAVAGSAGVVKNGKIVLRYTRDADYMISAIEELYGMKMR